MSVVLELFCIPHIYSVTEVLITCNCLDDILMYKWTITTRRHKKQSNRAEFCTWFFWTHSQSLVSELQCTELSSLRSTD